MGCEIFILQQLIHLEQSSSSSTVDEEGDDNVETHLFASGTTALCSLYSELMDVLYQTHHRKHHIHLSPVMVCRGFGAATSVRN